MKVRKGFLEEVLLINEELGEWKGKKGEGIPGKDMVWLVDKAHSERFCGSAK